MPFVTSALQAFLQLAGAGNLPTQSSPVTGPMSAQYRLPSLLSVPLAVLLAIAAAGAIFSPTVYAREVPMWAAEGIGQDWADLVLVAPLLVITALLTLRGSRVAALLLAGGLSYTLYSLVLYAFFVHFGPLFLVYTWALGFAFYALVTLVFALRQDDVRAWFGPRAPARLAGVVSVILGILFYLLWLSEVLPALASGAMPKSAVEAGLVTNPVHVLDLGIVLPAFIVGGMALARRRPLGYWLGTAMLGFAVVMDVALAAMVVSMNARGLGAGSPPLALFIVMTAISAGVLALLLRHVERARRGSGTA